MAFIYYVLGDNFSAVKLTPIDPSISLEIIITRKYIATILAGNF